MWYWDYFPPSGKYAKKPLTREQIKKLKENYQKADEIIAHVEQLEAKEKEKISKKAEDTLNELFL